MIYFDNASTTRPSPEVCDKMYSVLKNIYGNPSSLHSLGFSAEKEVEKARKILADKLGVKQGGIYFTSGGTEANNTAVIGTARAYKARGNHIVTVKTEHPSVYDSFAYLEKEGFSVTYLDVNEKGYIDLEELKSAVTPETILVSIMYVNNETGTLQDIEKIAGTVKSIRPECRFHTDCVQAFCKHNIPLENVDMLSVSSHKIHGPKGVGALWIKDGARCEPLHFGGSQEKGFRPGTENTSGIVGFGCAVENIGSIEENIKKVSAVKNELLKGIASLKDVYVNGDIEKGSPYILNISFKGVRGEVLLHALEDKEIYVATGSACSSKLKNKIKKVDYLVEGRGESAIRFSFCSLNTVEEARETAKALCELVPVLRRFQPR